MIGHRTALFVAIALALAAPASARRLAPQDLCLAAAQDAAMASGVPVEVLVALTLTETGRKTDGALQPWPWALNQGGDSMWFDTRDEAESYLSEAVGSDVSNIDVGCFQLNYGWHGKAFTSLSEMMEPVINARYAARLVAQHYEDSGDWVAAAGAFHSQTPEYAEKYLARFEPILESLGDTGDQAFASAEPVAPRSNDFPLLQAGVGQTLGSLVPRATKARPLFGTP